MIHFWSDRYTNYPDLFITQCIQALNVTFYPINRYNFVSIKKLKLLKIKICQVNKCFYLFTNLFVQIDRWVAWPESVGLTAASSISKFLFFFCIRIPRYFLEVPFFPPQKWRVRWPGCMGQVGESEAVCSMLRSVVGEVFSVKYISFILCSKYRTAQLYIHNKCVCNTPYYYIIKNLFHN